MKTLIFTDPHIEEKALEELEKIFLEIYKNKADRLIMLGDYFHKKNPTAKEIFWGTRWAKLFVEKYKEVIFIRGNHDKSKDTSAVDYLTWFDIEVRDEYIDKNNIFFGHFMTNKSLYEYGTYQKTIKELKKYNMVFLGHQHTFQSFPPEKIFHLGSCRYINFNEVKDENKYICIIKGKDWKFKKLKSPIPMLDVHSLKELPNIKDKNTKIRLIISSFEQFKDTVNHLSKWKNHFVEFKTKLNFEPIQKLHQKASKVKQTKRLEEVIKEGINKIKDKEVKKLLLEQIND